MLQNEAGRLASELLGTLGAAHAISYLSQQYPGFSLDDGYEVAHQMRTLREARGERVVGRKIGGTNPATYAQSGAKGPMWNFIYDTAAHDIAGRRGTCHLGQFRQSRLEPEIVLHVSEAPRAGMSQHEIVECIDMVALGYEIVHSPFADWKVPPPDSVAAFGLHQAMFIGRWHNIVAEREAWIERLRSVNVTTLNNFGETASGSGADVLGSPLNALRAIVDDIALHPNWSPVAAGEIISTGTLTRLMPAEIGQVWTTVADQPQLEQIVLEIA